MPIAVTCPSCSRKLRVPDDLLGKRVKCPTCNNVFEASLSEEAPPAPLPEVEDDPSPVLSRSKGGSRAGKGDSVRPRRDSSAGRAQDEDDDLPRSKSRRDDDDDLPRSKSRRDDDDDRPSRRRPRRRRDDGSDYEPHRGTLVLVLGIVGCSCFILMICGGFFGLPGWIASIILAIAGLGCSVSAWVLGGKDLGRIKAGELDPEGKGATTGGMVCGIVGTALNAIGLGCSLLCIFGVLAMLGISMGAAGANQGKPGGKFSAPQRGLPRISQNYLPPLAR